MATKSSGKQNTGTLFHHLDKAFHATTFPFRNRFDHVITHITHPAGNPAPSPDDVAATRAIVQAGRLLDVEVLDHLVISQGRWVSLKERGLRFV